MRQPTAALALAVLCLVGERASAAESLSATDSRIEIADAIRRGLDRDEAELVRVRGVVTLAYDDNSAFAVQDDSGGIWATTFHRPSEAPERATRAALRLGDEVVLAGRLDRGGYAPLVIVDELQVIGSGLLPEPLAADLPRLFRGGDNCRRVAVEGIVRSVHDDGRYDGLILDVDSRQMLARFPRTLSRESAAAFVDATVRVVGVTSAVRNARGEFLCPTLSIASAADIEVIDPSPGLPFDAPFIDLARVARFSGEPVPRHRIRTSGTVSMVLSGEVLFLAAAAGGLRVQAATAAEFQPGDVVEVAGFIDMNRQIAGLGEAVIRRLERSAPPEPQDIAPDEIVAINALARRKGQIAAPGDFDGCLVTFPGRVVEVRPSTSGGGQITLSSGGVVILATMEGAPHLRIADILPGSDVRVTGIIQLQLRDDEGLRAVRSDPTVQQISLLMRSAADVLVVSEPSWWTPSRLAVLLAAVVTVLAAALVWVVLLRRQVRATTHRLAEEMQSRRNTAIEFQATLRERNRLAANLHDTLLQTLRGIDFQLGACEAHASKPAADPWAYLDVARKMVNHAAEELRGSVWALRTMPVAGKSFAESLEAIARQAGHGHAEHIAVHTSGTPFELPQFVAGNLLLVAQEAIQNSLAHADAGQIDVVAAFDAGSGTVDVTVVDDGRGFAHGEQSGPDQGHFGLTGMRERIDRMGGEFSIATGPSRGTTVHACVRKREYDSRLEAQGSE